MSDSASFILSIFDSRFMLVIVDEDGECRVVILHSVFIGRG